MNCLFSSAKTFLFLGFFLLAAACSSKPVRSPAMIGGSEMQHSSEVFFGNCTGTMIAPYIILTAGHCVFGFDDDRKLNKFFKNKDELLVQSFDGENPTKPKRSFIVNVENTFTHPSWDEALRNSSGSADTAADGAEVSDIGIIVLDHNLPVKSSPLPSVSFLENPPKNMVGLLVFGAGCTARGATNTMGTLKGAVFTDLRRYPTKIEIVPKDALTNAPAGLCKRDSGGGAFVLTQDSLDFNTAPVVAVNSILSGTAAQALSDAPTGSFHARVDKKEVLDWLKVILNSKAPNETAPNLEP